MVDEEDKNEYIIKAILEEIRALRQDFAERNRIIDDSLKPQEPPPPTPQELLNQWLMQQVHNFREMTFVDVLIKVIGTTFDKAATYTNIFIIGGYAAFFSLWSVTQKILTSKQSAWSALFMLLSGMIFVGFEIVKMLIRTEYVRSLQRINAQHPTTDPEAARRQFLETQQKFEVYENKFIYTWRWAVYLTTILALLAVLVLINAFVSLIML